MNLNLRKDVAIFWFRRDLRLRDNHALYQALISGFPVLPVFIFDDNILKSLPIDDARVNFIFDSLESIQKELQIFGVSLLIKEGEPVNVWKTLLTEYQVKAVYTNHDYEPYAIERDGKICDLLKTFNIPFFTFKDQVIFEKNEILKLDGTPYTIFTPFKNKWLQKFAESNFVSQFDTKPYFQNFAKLNFDFPTLESIGFKKSEIKVKPFQLENIAVYEKIRDLPFIDQTTQLSPHLRFGTVSVREMTEIGAKTNATFLSELIWREFFMMILFHFPRVTTESFKKKYDRIQWINNEEHFEKWTKGETGYPLVDAGMRQLNATGYMHNRVRMVVASFLCKHLLIDWRWGEAYFAEKLLDFELSSNNGNWQWAAGTGCDAAPYFRVFNPEIQQKKFDPQFQYIKRWIPDYNKLNYLQPIVNHEFARDKAIKTYKIGIES